MKKLALKIINIAIAYNVLPQLSKEFLDIQINGMVHVFETSGLSQQELEDICVRGINSEFGTIFRFNPGTVNEWIRKTDVNILIPSEPCKKFLLDFKDNPEVIVKSYHVWKSNGYKFKYNPSNGGDWIKGDVKQIGE